VINVATPLIEDLGRRALPVLVDCAQKRQLITYGELARRIDASHHRTSASL